MSKHLAEVANLQNIFLKKSHFELFKSDVIKGSSLTISTNLEHEFEGEKEDAYLKCKYGTSIKGTSPESEIIFSLDVEFVAVYSLNEVLDWDESQIHMFMDKCVNLHVWPFLREHVHSISSKSNIPTVMLPLLPSGHKKKESKD
ncbi:MAG: preprotein translocase subunit SecB [Cocleimonas sp.]|jgi:preprotein translocase subunit SecB